MDPIYKEDSWTVSEARSEGALWIVRTRSDLPALPDRAIHDNLILISWEYDAGESGMPQPSDFDSMNRFEDAIEAGLGPGGLGVQAASVTGNGLKEWRYYTHDTEQFMAGFNAALAGQAAYPIKLEVFQDPEWNALSELLPAP